MSSRLSAGIPDWLTSTPPGVMWPHHMRKRFCFNISSMVFVYVWFLCLDVQPAEPPLAGLLRLQEDWRPDTGSTGPAASRRYLGARVGGQWRLCCFGGRRVGQFGAAARSVQSHDGILLQLRRSRGQSLPVSQAFGCMAPFCDARLYPQWPLTSENQRLGPERHRTSLRFDLEVPQLHRKFKKYCGRRRTDQSEDSVRTDAASSDWRAASDSSSSSVCSCTVLCVCMCVCACV